MAILLIGHGLQLAYVPLRTELLGWSNMAAGVLGSTYFAGFLAGCFLIPKLVSKTGHVRTFATLSALGTASILGLALSEQFEIWLLLRFVVGVSIAGLYLVIESWFNELVANEVRGGVLAIYTIIVLASMAIDQLLVNIAPIQGEVLIIISAIFFVAAAIPVCITHTAQPAQNPTASFSPFLVLRTSRAATVGALVSGMVTGTFYSIGPVYGLQIGLEIREISAMMALGILGGAATQLPLGRLSDNVDRRLVIFAIMAMGSIVAMLAVLVATGFVPFMMIVFGGCTMPIYALSLAHASDNSKSSSFLEIGTGLLIVHAGGAIIGPLVAALAMSILGPEAFFAFNGFILLLGGAVVLYLIQLRSAGRKHFSEFEMATTVGAQGAFHLDPRAVDSTVEPDS